MTSIRKRGGSYLLVVSMGYAPDGRRRNPQQKTVRPPAGPYAKADGEVVTGTGDAVRNELQEDESRY